LAPRREMTPEKRLIVNADELGLSPGVNAGVVEAHRQGIVTSASLMVTGSAAAAGAALAKESPELGVGLHVVLMDGVAVSSAIDVPALVDRRGALPADMAALATVPAEQILEEVRAQYRRFRQLMGRLPSHLDARANAHSLRPVFEALVTLAWETGLPVRGTSAAMRSRLRQEDIRTTDEYLDREVGLGAAVTGLLGVLARLSAGTTELRCLPARSEEGPGVVGDSPGQRDLAVLTDPEVRASVRALGIRLLHFGQL
jgi:predicted glycoside hydrolase/deacetylase ChbG (UPF0249 family)